MAYGFTCDRCGASYKRNNVILTTRGSKRSDHTLQGFALVDVKGILPRRFDLCDDCLCQLISWIHPTLNADMKKSDPEWLDMLKNTRMRAIYSTKVVEDANEERVEHNTYLHDQRLQMTWWTTLQRVIDLLLLMLERKGPEN